MKSKCQLFIEPIDYGNQFAIMIVVEDKRYGVKMDAGKHLSELSALELISFVQSAFKTLEEQLNSDPR